MGETGKKQMSRGKSIFISHIYIVMLALSCVISYNGDWWDISWNHRMLINITAVDEVPYGYPLELTLNTEELISRGVLNPGCSDIRFVISMNETQLPYWIESGCNTTSTKVWVKLPAIPPGNYLEIYIYYDNPLASSTSDGKSVFEFFEDFSYFNSTRWSRSCPSDSLFSVEEGVLMMSAGSIFVNDTVGISTLNRTLEALVSFDLSYTSDASGIWISNSTEFVEPGYNTSASLYVNRTGVISNYTDPEYYTSNYTWPAIEPEYHILGITLLGDKTNYTVDGEVITTVSDAWDDGFHIGFGASGGGAAGCLAVIPLRIDWIRIRRTLQEPPDIVVGGEEKRTPPIVISIIESVDYNVTYNSTDDTEYPDESIESNEKRLKAAGEIIIRNNSSYDLSDVRVILDNTEKFISLPVYNPYYSETWGHVVDIDGWSQETGGRILLHIPDLSSGEMVLFDYILM